MRLFFLLTSWLLASCYPGNLSAQATGNWTLAVGIGAVPTFTKGPRRVDTPPLAARLDYRVHRHVQLGAYFGYSATTSLIDYSHDGLYLPLRNDYYIGGLRATFLTAPSTRSHLYGGAMLGYNLPVISQVGSDAPVVLPRGKPHYYRLPEASCFLSGFVGGRYALTSRVGIYGELGFGVSLLQMGLSVSL